MKGATPLLSRLPVPLRGVPGAGTVCVEEILRQRERLRQGHGPLPPARGRLREDRWLRSRSCRCKPGAAKHEIRNVDSLFGAVEKVCTETVYVYECDEQA